MLNPIFPADKIIDRGQRFVFLAGNEKVKADFMELLLARRFCEEGLRHPQRAFDLSLDSNFFL